MYSGDIVTVTKIVSNIQKKRGKYLELDGKAVVSDGEEVDDSDDIVLDLEGDGEEEV